MSSTPSYPGLFDAAEAARALAVLADPAGGVELMRLPGGWRVRLSGGDVQGMLEQLARWGSGGASGLYYSLGVVDPALARNALVDDVLRRRWLLIDCDPRKPKDTNATADEKSAAHQVAETVRDYLTGLGWPAPVLIDSGNGYHLLYRIDLPNGPDDGTRPLVMRVLRALAGRFDTPTVTIDTSVGNPNRHGKVPGSWTRKGPHAPDRPHRPCRLIHLPDELAIVSRELLAELAGPEPPRPDPSRFVLRVPAGSRYGAVALEREIGGLLLAERRNDGLNKAGFRLFQLVAGGVLTEAEVTARLTEVALHVGLTERETAATLASARQAGMQQPRGIPDRVGMRGGSSLPAFPSQATPGGASGATPRSHTPAPHRNGVPVPPRAAGGSSGKEAAPALPESDPEKGKGWRFEPIDSAAFDACDYRPTWLVKRFLVANQPAVVGGPQKCMKTSVAVDLAVSLASGQPFLDEFQVYRPVRVAVLSGESGAWTLQETARRVCQAKGVRLAELPLLWQFELPQLANPGDLAELAGGLRLAGVAVVLIDPLYLSLLSGTVDLSASNLYQMGPLLLGVARACLGVGATPLLLHHANRRAASYDPLQLSDLAYSGIAEFARQWILLQRRGRYVAGQTHELWLSAGGSCGQGGLWHLDITEGELQEDFGGRTWAVEVRSASDPSGEPGAATDRKAEAERDEERRLLAAMDAADPDGGGMTETEIRAALKMSGRRFGPIVERLIAGGLLERVTLSRANGQDGRRRQVDGFRRRYDVFPD